MKVNILMLFRRVLNTIITIDHPTPPNYFIKSKDKAYNNFFSVFMSETQGSVYSGNRCDQYLFLKVHSQTTYVLC